MTSTRARAASTQHRIRLVLLGYPDPQLPAKVANTFVRNDTTEDLDASHVRAFLDFCMKAAGKNFDDTWLQSKAAEICALAHANVNDVMPFLEALNTQLKEWYKSL
jgi:hypothetical protein